MSTLTYGSIPSSAAGRQINVLRCTPDTPPRAIVQLTHGMVEYIGRYEELARYLADRGFAVIGHDHLGHGGSIRTPADYGYFARPDGNRTLLEDLHNVTRLAKTEWPGRPVFLLGHSMGSFYARQYLCDYGIELSGAILMGTGHQPLVMVQGGRALCRVLAALHGWHHRSELVNKMAFGAFNRAFEPARTSSDWLNRDPAEVDRYLAEERCTFIFTLNGYYSMFTGIARLHDKRVLAKMPKNLPVLLLSGDADPVGENGRAVQRAAESLRRAGLGRVSVKLYPGARHELLLELNRREVFGDIAGWIEKQLAN